MLTPTQIQAVQFLVSGHTYAETAKAVCVSSRTISNWIVQDEFKEELEKARRAIQISVMGRIVPPEPPDAEKEIKDVADVVAFNLSTRLTGLIPTVVNTLEEILTNKKAKDGDRIRAGQVICDLAGLTRANTVNVNVGTQSMDQANLKELPDDQFRELIGLPANLDLSRVSDEDVMRLAGVEDREWNQES